MTRLRYVSTEEPGYKRKKWGRGFTYLDLDGKIIDDPELREWIESITIPPAWTDVWISPYINGHILATGRDDKGRKQYRYHPDWVEIQSQKKFDHLQDFGKALPEIRRVTDQHLREHRISRERVLSAVVRLLENTLIRVGNDEYALNNDSYGLTTLTDDHVEISGTTISFEFIGKSGKEHSITLRDKRLARIVKHCQDIPGYALFQYIDESNEPQIIDSADVNAFLQEITGKSFTAKVFRTWGGSILAIKYLCEVGMDVDKEIARRDCVTYVADTLGNTKAVCRDYYIHPLIFEAHLNGTLQEVYRETKKSKHRSKYMLNPEEETLVKLIAQSQS